MCPWVTEVRREVFEREGCVWGLPSYIPESFCLKMLLGDSKVKTRAFGGGGGGRIEEKLSLEI